MVERRGGMRKKSRSKMTKGRSSRGKVSLTSAFTVYAPGAKVGLIAEPAVQNGMYHPKFYGLTGTVLSRVGKCYRVEITDVNKKKVLFIHPVHLRGVSV